MKPNIVGLAALALLGAAGPIAHAASITYDSSFTDGSNTLTGTIQTNGTLGAITATDITAWAFTVTGPDAISINSSAPGGTLACNAITCFTASAASLTFDFASTTAIDTFADFTGVVGLVGTGHPDPTSPPLIFSCAGNSSYDCTSGFTNSYSFNANGEVAIAAAVPEPSTLSLLALGLAGASLVKRRKPAVRSGLN
jgi:PEP-CTERM motif